MLRRAYGNTGEQLSVIGFGGIVVANVSDAEAKAYVAEAVDAGVTYFDVAPSYGNAEDMLGPALEQYRKNVFLACKTGQRTKQEAHEELETSLQKLRTDHFDLYQLHGMTSQEDFDQAVGPNGVLETVQKAKEEGLIRHIGFSSHSIDIALKLMDAFDFQSVLLPVNFVNWFNGQFGLQVMDKAKAKGMAVLALKAMAKCKVDEGMERKYPKCWYIPVDEQEIATLAVRWALSQGVTAAIPPGDIRLFRMALKSVEGFELLKPEEEQRLMDYAKGLQPIFSV